jgi:iron complex outermembrane receptor protein
LSVISHEQIETYGWISINDILFKQPGFAPSKDYDRTTVTARGLFEGWNNNHLLMLVDGVPVNDSIYGSAYTWEITPLVLAQSIDIIRGPGSALYGSNATNGVIALHTPDAGVMPLAMGQFRFGNAGTRIYDVAVAHRFRLVDFVVAYNHYETDGNIYSSYDGSGRLDGSGALAKFDVSDGRSSDYVFAKLSGNGVLRGLSLQLHLQFWKFGTGHGWLFYIPDAPEQMNEDRQIASISYRPPPSWQGRFQQEYVLQYQRHGINWHTKYYPNDTTIGTGTSAVTYPSGLVEDLVTDAHQFFARAQYSLRIWRELTAVAGVEDSLFLYTGDKQHDANADIDNGGSLRPLPTYQPLRPWFEYVTNRPVENLGIFVQAATGRFLRRALSITAGLRYDLQWFDYVDINDPRRQVASRTFNQVSPRLAIVAFPFRDLVLKAMVDRAFRAPAPSELFGANTYSLTSSIKQLRPEDITTVSVAADWLLVKHIDLRADWFYEVFDNQIAYSVSNANLSTNLYSRSVTGLEAEVSWDAPLGSAGKLGGYGNYTFVDLVSESIDDPTIAKSGALTWAPAHTFNLGINFSGHHLGASLQGHFQGPVARRSSDDRRLDFAAYRPATVPAWFTLDGRIAYSITNWVRVGVQATNLLNSRGYLIKNDNFPFDYQIEGVRVLGTLAIDVGGIPR